jgi:D-glycero-alpha-D-manno-heptose-7-phosphate kinase
MIITKTPYRISFFGGGSDYPDWYKEHGGQVLSTTINKHNYISCRYLPPFFEHKLRLVYSVVEECNDASELDHPSAREVLKFLEISDKVELHYDGDLPGRSGTGSSSSFTVGLLNALYSYKGIKVGAKRLAEEAIYIEQKLIGETVGSQDQIAAAYGGFNHIKFKKDNSFSVNKVSADKDKILKLDSNLMLFFTGISRYAEKIAKTYVNDISKKEMQIKKMSSMVDEGLIILNDGDLDDFGILLNEAWKKKKELSDEVTTSRIDEIYDKAMNAGATGGKISGAGGGGFMFFYVPEEKQDDLMKSLSDLTHVPFKFEESGSTVIFDEKKNDE